MAVINIPYANHGEQPTVLEDMVTYLRLALTEAGHVVNITPFIDRKVFNVIIEAFDDAVTEVLLDAAKDGVRFAVVATEIITGTTFNDFKFKDGDESHYSDRRGWDMRYRNFVKVGLACKNIWGWTKGQLKDYESVFLPDWLHLIPIGYLDGFATVESRADANRDFDFVFTGTLTKRRNAILLSLQEAGMNVITVKFITPAFIRNNLISRAKICLGLKQFDDWKYPSLMRNYYHIMNTSYLLTEAYELPSLLDPYIHVVEPTDLIRVCLETVKKNNLTEIAKKNLERFRDEMPLKPKFAAFLAKSFSQS